MAFSTNREETYTSYLQGDLLKATLKDFGNTAVWGAFEPIYKKGC